MSAKIGSRTKTALKDMALAIYAESDKCTSRNESMVCRRNLLNEIPKEERWMVKEYVRRIGRERQRKVARGNYRNDLASAIEKGKV